MRKKIICVCAMLAVVEAAACTNGGNSDIGTGAEAAVEQEEEDRTEGYASRLVTLGEYKGLSYRDVSGREPTDEEIEEEMEAILEWFDGGELTDAFVQENLDFDSVEAFREDTRINLKDVYAQNAWSQAAMELYRTVVASSSFEMDSSDVEEISEEYREVYSQEAEAAGMEFSEYLTQVLGMTEEEFDEAAEEIVQVSLVAEAIVEEEKLDTAAAYEQQAQQLAEENGFESVGEMEEMSGTDGTLREEIIYRLAADFMMQHGNPRPGL